MIKNIAIHIALACVLCSTLALPAYAALPAGFEEEVVADGLFIPTVFDFSSDGRIFIAEKNGTVRVVKNGQLLPTPFITLTDINTSGDRGLIGMALDRDFASNGYVYLSYTHENSPEEPDGPKTSRIVRVTADGDVADLSTYTILVGSVAGSPVAPSCQDVAITDDCIPSDSLSHSVGGLRFGPDGYLYASTGDGADFTRVDPAAELAQNIDSLGGKFLRIDRDGNGVPSNPYYTGDPTDNRSKVWAYGMRNAYRFSFHPDSDLLYAGDVGWFYREEINIIEAGKNYGWPCWEGTRKHDGYDCDASGPGELTYPLYEYERDFDADPNDAISVVAGDILGERYPAAYRGDYIFGDFHRNDIYRMVLSEDGRSVVAVEEWLDNEAAGPVAIQVGPNGFLHYISIFTGELRRLVYRTNEVPNAVITADTLTGDAPLTVSFSGLSSSDPEDDTLTYAWDLGDGTAVEGPTPSHTYTSDGLYTVVLTVTDTADNFDKATAVVAVGDQSDGEAADPTLIALTRSIDEVVVGSILELSAEIRNDGESDPVRVEFAVRNTNTGATVATEVVERLDLEAGASEVASVTWIPERSGTFAVDVVLSATDGAPVYEETSAAMTFPVADREPVSGPFAPTLRQLDTSDAPFVVGQPIELDAIVENPGVAGDTIALMTIHQDAPNLLEASDELAIAGGGVETFSVSWTPTATGTYFVDLGLFFDDWSDLYEWNWHAAEFEVVEDTGTSTGTTTPPATTTDPFVPTLSVVELPDDIFLGEEVVIRSFIANSGIAGEVIALSTIHQDGPNEAESAEVVAIETLGDGETEISWTPTETGTYFFDVGLFAPDWSEMYEWNWHAAEFEVVEDTGTSTGTTTPPATSTDPFLPTLLDAEVVAGGEVGEELTIRSTVENTGMEGNAIALSVIHQDGPENLAEFSEVLTFTTLGEETTDLSWTPTEPGTYYFDFGLFTPDWGEMYEWNWHRLEVVIDEDTSSGGDPGGDEVTLTIATASSNPDPSTILVDTTEPTNDVTVMVLDIVAEGGVQTIETVHLTYAVTGGTFESVFTDLTLELDGTPFTSWSRVDDSTLAFDLATSGGFTIPAGATVEANVRVDFAPQAGNYENSSTIEFDVDASARDSWLVTGSDVVAGSADGMTHTLVTEGIFAEIVSTDADTRLIDGGTREAAVFTFVFDATALKGDFFIAQDGEAATLLTFYNNSAPSKDNATVPLVEGSNLLAATLTSNADTSESGNAYLVRDGESERFTLEVEVAPEEIGEYALQLDSVFYSDVDLPTYTTFEFEARPEQDFITESVAVTLVGGEEPDPEPEPTTSTVFYQNGLGESISDWSWGGSFDPLSTETVFDPTYAGKFTYSSVWGGLYLAHLTGVATIPEDSVWLRLYTEEGQELSFNLYDENYEEFSRSSFTSRGGWQTIKFPTTPSVIGGVILQANSGTVETPVFIDLIEVRTDA